MTSLAGLGAQFTDDILKDLADDYPQVRVAAIAALGAPAARRRLAEHI